MVGEQGRLGPFWEGVVALEVWRLALWFLDVLPMLSRLCGVSVCAKPLTNSGIVLLLLGRGGGQLVRSGVKDPNSFELVERWTLVSGSPPTLSVPEYPSRIHHGGRRSVDRSPIMRF